MNDQEFSSRSYPVNEDMEKQLKDWRFERIGWFFLLVLVGCALAGFFSKGPFSSVESQTANGELKVKFERFTRNGAQDNFLITSTGPPKEIRYLVLGGELLEGMSIESLNPQPAPLRSEGRDLVIPMKSDNDGIATLYITMRSNGIGFYKGYVRPLRGDEISISKFIYP